MQFIIYIVASGNNSDVTKKNPNSLERRDSSVPLIKVKDCRRALSFPFSTTSQCIYISKNKSKRERTKEREREI